MTTKSELRQTFLQRQRGLPPQDAQRHSRQICGLFLETFAPVLHRIRIVHCFLPIIKNGEIDTWLIVRQLQSEFPHLAVAIPRTDPPSGAFTSHLLTPQTVLAPNRWGIPEPQNGEPIAPATVDLVLVPLLAFDRAGRRVGYGKGFYDRFLAQCRPGTPKIGLSYFDPVERIGDINEFDVALDACVTPGRVWQFGSPQPRKETQA